MGRSNAKINQPTYKLAALKKAVRSHGASAFTGSALAGMALLGMSVQDAIYCIDNLSSGCFYKTMPSVQDPTFHQDVYRGWYWGKEIYIKFTGYTNGRVVISFKAR